MNKFVFQYLEKCQKEVSNNRFLSQHFSSGIFFLNNKITEDLSFILLKDIDAQPLDKSQYYTIQYDINYLLYLKSGSIRDIGLCLYHLYHCCCVSSENIMRNILSKYTIRAHENASVYAHISFSLCSLTYDI